MYESVSSAPFHPFIFVTILMFQSGIAPYSLEDRQVKDNFKTKHYIYGENGVILV